MGFNLAPKVIQFLTQRFVGLSGGSLFDQYDNIQTGNCGSFEPK